MKDLAANSEPRSKESIKSNVIQRDSTLDFLRGFALITITFNHISWFVDQSNLGFKGLKIPTVTYFMYSSCAEIFFLISGYLIGLIYIKKGRSAKNTFKKLIERSLQLTIYNWVVFLILLALAPFLHKNIAQFSHINEYIENPKLIIQFIYFANQPVLLQILLFYSYLIFIAPFFIQIFKRTPTLATIATIVLYIIIQIFPQYNVPGGDPYSSKGLGFNLFAWQILFMGGIAVGSRDMLTTFKEWSCASWKNFIISTVPFVIITTAYFLQKFTSIGDAFAFNSDQQSLAPIRLLNTVLFLLFSIAILARIEYILLGKPFNWITNCGKNSLDTFAASIVLTYIASQVWTLYAPSHSAYYIISFASIALLMIYSNIQLRWKLARV